MSQNLTPNMDKSSSSSSSPVNTDSLSRSNFAFYRGQNVNAAQPRTLVIIYGWLFVQQNHLNKFCKLYLDKPGLDVLTIRASLLEILFPLYGSRPIAAALFAFLSANHTNYSSIIFHTFSIGTYQMGELFVLLEQEQHLEISNKIRPLIKGIVYDSPVDVDYGPIGLAKVVTNNSILQWVIVLLVKCHLNVLHPWVTRYYKASSAEVHRNGHKYAALFFLSEDDVVSRCEHSFEAIHRWRASEVQVMVKCWHQSPHVSHFYKHPKEYQLHLDQFVATINQFPNQ